MIDIPQGATFKSRSVYLGMLFMATSFIMTIYAALNHWTAVLPAIPFFAVGLVIFMDRRGTSIDPATRRFRPYRDLVLFRIGPWIPLDGISAVRVERERESYSHNPNHANIMYNRTNFWCFNVTLHGEGLVRTLFLKEYYEAGPALALGQQVAGALSIPLEDATVIPPSSYGRRR